MDVARKLALKDRRLEILGAPAGFVLAGAEGQGSPPAVLAFARDRAELERRLSTIVASASADQLTWVAYPKAGQLGTDLNRDSLADILRARGLRPVTQIALDETWSALRFRPGRD